MKKLALEEETTVVFQSRIKLTRNVFQCKLQENKTQRRMMQDVPSCRNRIGIARYKKEANTVGTGIIRSAWVTNCL